MNRKLLMMALASLTCVRMAIAADADIPGFDKGLIPETKDTAAIKKACEESNETVWVEKDGVCVPVNPCVGPAKRREKYEKYCNQFFKDTQVNERLGMGSKLIEIYARRRLGIAGLNPAPYLLQAPGIIGQDFMAIKQNGDYVVFEFDDLSENESVKARANYVKAVCLAYGGTVIPRASRDTADEGSKIYYGRNTYITCGGLSESDWDEMRGKKEVSLEDDGEYDKLG